MSSDGSYTGLWADGNYRFRLAIGQLRELQEKCNAGPPEIFERLMKNTWRVDDVRETLRLGLIGGGTPPSQALALVIRYVDMRPWMENVPAALEVMGAALVGDPNDQPGKTQLGEQNEKDCSSSPSSTELEQSSGGTPELSTTSASGSSPSPPKASRRRIHQKTQLSP